MKDNRTSTEKCDVENGTTERHAVVHQEYTVNRDISAEDEGFLAIFPEEKKKKAIRKVRCHCVKCPDTVNHQVFTDLESMFLRWTYGISTHHHISQELIFSQWRLVPMLLVLYLITYIDKTNIGNAKIEGMLKSLHMDGTQYNIALSIFFIPYVLAEVPSNMIMERFRRPSLYLGSLVLSWGIIMTCTGLSRNFAGLTVIRFLLGLFEAGFFPGAVLLISKWYLPHETQTRIALLYSSAASGGALSGLLAFVIAKMDGIGGYEGWRWIFIVEGLVTVAMGVACFFFLIDSPALSSRWLDADEIRYLELRQSTREIQNTKDTKKKTVHWDALSAVMTDWKIYLLILVNWSNAVPNYALKFTMPQIIKNMGFTSAKAQLLTIPPYAMGAISAYAFSVFADRYTWRMPFIVVPQLTLVVSFSILFTKAADIEDNIGLCYFAVCLACFGMYPILPGVNAWNVSNLAGPAKRAIGIGWLICAGNIGGVIGSYIYIEKEAPKYPTGFGASFGFASAGIIAAFVLEVCLWRINKRNARFTEEQIRAQFSDEELERMGDKSPLYKYSL